MHVRSARYARSESYSEADCITRKDCNSYDWNSTLMSCSFLVTAQWPAYLPVAMNLRERIAVTK